MPMLIVQLAALIAIAFIVGCFLGRFLRGAMGKSTAEEQILIAAAQSTPADVEPNRSTDGFNSSSAEALVHEPEQTTREIGGESASEQTQQDEKLETPEVEIDRPQWREAPRRGKPDNLTAIHGIGNAVRDMLFKLGIFHYDQIAAWTADEASWINHKIGFRGRVEREGWVAQAISLVEEGAKKAGKDRKSRVAKPKTTRKSNDKSAS